MKTEAGRPRSNGTRRPDEILQEIERTRTEMDSTLGAIEHRLTPGQLMDQGLDYLRSSGAPEFLSNLRGSVKDNPLPVTLVGVGLAWLMAADRGSRRGAGASSAAESARSYLQGASGAMDAGKQKLGDTTRAARERLEQARGSYERIANEQPLALGAIGLAIGAVLAASLPRTRMEEKAGDALGDSLNAGQPERAAAEATRTTGSNRAAPEGPLSAPMPAPAVETRPVPREPAPEAKPSAPTAGRPAPSPR